MANKVELYNNGTLIGTDNAPVVSGGNWTYSIPYTAASGNDVLTAKAFVDNVEVASSGVRNVVVNAGGGGGSFEPEYQTWLNYISSNGYDVPSSTQQNLDNTKIANLKAEGVWTELDFLYMNEAVYSPASYATNAYRVNFKNPGTFTRNADAGKEPAWVSGKGFKVLANSGNFQKTGFIPSTHAVKSVSNNASIIMKLFDAPTTLSATARIYGGKTSTGTTGTMIAATSSAFLARIYQTGGLGFPAMNINNHIHISIQELNVKVGVNGVDSGTTIAKDSAVAIATVEQIEFGYTDTPNVPSLTAVDLGISYLMQGSNLKTKEAVIYSIMNGTY